MASRIKILQTYSRFFTISPPSLKDEGRHSTTEYSLCKLYQKYVWYTIETYIIVIIFLIKKVAVMNIGNLGTIFQINIGE